MQCGSLPYPFSGFLVIVFSVALPQCYYPAVKTSGIFPFIVSGDKTGLAFQQRVRACPVIWCRLPVESQFRKSELREFISVGKYLAAAIWNAIIAQKIVKALSEPANLVFVPWVEREFRIEIKVYPVFLNTGPCDVQFLLYAYFVDKEPAQAVTYRLILDKSRCRPHGASHEEKACAYGDSMQDIVHFLWWFFFFFMMQ